MRTAIVLFGVALGVGLPASGQSPEQIENDLGFLTDSKGAQIGDSPYVDALYRRIEENSDVYLERVLPRLTHPTTAASLRDSDSLRVYYGLLYVVSIASVDEWARLRNEAFHEVSAAYLKFLDEQADASLPGERRMHAAQAAGGAVFVLSHIFSDLARLDDDAAIPFAMSRWGDPNIASSVDSYLRDRGFEVDVRRRVLTWGCRVEGAHLEDSSPLRRPPLEAGSPFRAYLRGGRALAWASGPAWLEHVASGPGQPCPEAV